jgi:spermidine synthase
MALLGFAISGTVLSISGWLKKISNAKFYFLCLIGFSITAYFAAKFAYQPIRNTFSLSPDPQLILNLFITYTISMLPYFFAGLAISGSFLRFPNIKSVLYFANLLGSGLGCVLFILLIGPLGAIHMVLLTSLACITILVPIIKGNKLMQFSVLPWLIFLFIGVYLPDDSKLNQILPESHKQFWIMFEENTQVEYTEWNPISRIDVISDVRFPRDKHILMDGDAQAALFDMEFVKHVSSSFNYIDRYAAYTLLGEKAQRVLIIGAGGGFDVLLAAINGAQKIDAVEINPTTARLVRTTYSPLLGNIFKSPNVSLAVEDGRSFARRTKNQYDIIMMCATDSLTALSTGAYVLSDNYLYTKDAFIDYLNRLKEDGFLQIGRWYFHAKPRETLRIFSTALEALRREGYKEPASNVVVISPNKNWADVIIKRKPFSKEEKERLNLFCSKHNIKILFSEELLRAYGKNKVDSAFLELADSFLKGTEEEFYSKYEYNVKPVSDDSPFFYQYDKLQKPRQESQHQYYDRIRGVWHIFVLSLLLIHSVTLSLLLVLLPLIFIRKNKYQNKLYTFIYFLSIGFAFMLAEMSIIQKFVLFLGHPTYSMSVVIPAMLIFAGLGSLVSHWIKNKTRMYICISTFICCFFILLLRYLIPNITNLLLMQPLYIRIATVIATIAPLSFFMGFPFPLALKSISGHSQESIPWAWAINGTASVVASIIAVIIAMQFGFRAVLTSSALFYLIASISTFILSRRIPS